VLSPGCDVPSLYLNLFQLFVCTISLNPFAFVHIFRFVPFFFFFPLPPFYSVFSCLAVGFLVFSCWKTGTFFLLQVSTQRGRDLSFCPLFSPETYRGSRPFFLLFLWWWTLPPPFFIPVTPFLRGVISLAPPPPPLQNAGGPVFFFFLGQFRLCPALRRVAAQHSF